MLDWLFHYALDFSWLLAVVEWDLGFFFKNAFWHWNIIYRHRSWFLFLGWSLNQLGSDLEKDTEKGLLDRSGGVCNCAWGSPHIFGWGEHGFFSCQLRRSLVENCELESSWKRRHGEHIRLYFLFHCGCLLLVFCWGFFGRN